MVHNMSSVCVVYIETGSIRVCVCLDYVFYANRKRNQ